MAKIQGGQVAGGTSKGKGGIRRAGGRGGLQAGSSRRRNTKLDKVAREGKTAQPRPTRTVATPRGRNE